MGHNKQLLEILGEIGIDDQENFSQETIERFKSDPEFYHRFAKAVEKEVNNGFPMVSQSRVYRAKGPLLTHVLQRSWQEARYKPLLSN